MHPGYQSYDPLRAECELQEAKLREKAPREYGRDCGKRLAFRISTVIACLVILYFLLR